jgi:hypothetical protein
MTKLEKTALRQVIATGKRPSVPGARVPDPNHPDHWIARHDEYSAEDRSTRQRPRLPEGLGQTRVELLRRRAGAYHGHDPRATPGVHRDRQANQNLIGQVFRGRRGRGEIPCSRASRPTWPASWRSSGPGSIAGPSDTPETNWRRSSGTSWPGAARNARSPGTDSGSGRKAFVDARIVANDHVPTDMDPETYRVDRRHRRKDY